MLYIIISSLILVTFASNAMYQFPQGLTAQAALEKKLNSLIIYATTLDQAEKTTAEVITAIEAIEKQYGSVDINADYHIKNFQGTLLDSAIHAGLPTLVAYLMKKGADPYRDHSGWSMYTSIFYHYSFYYDKQKPYDTQIYALKALIDNSSDEQLQKK